ncbi:MAG: phosphoribosylaminoimidazolesuccinocarboxamide synthase [Acidimicrobiia bacterium]
MVALQHAGSGKVREIFALGEERLLIVATDRISAYDVILPDPIPDKGRVLTQLTAFWLDHLPGPHHLLSMDTAGLEVPGVDDLDGRAMIVRRADPIPLECVVRGYLYGSAWDEYRGGGGPTTEHLPEGLRLTDKLPEPIFTPATKAVEGHDENLTRHEARRLVGPETYDTLRRRSLALYELAALHAEAAGLILADTKFEFGTVDGEFLLIDEVLTPDSSRYWPAANWNPPDDVPSFDKQYVRAWLDEIGWDRRPPAPSLPPEIIAGTRDRYLEAYQRISQQPFEQDPGT